MAKPLVFLILAHDDPRHLERLCRALAPHPVYVHLDAKAGPLELDLPPNAHLLEERFEVHWAGFEMIEATLALIRRAEADGLGQHNVLLSGRCYPIRPVGEFAGHLARMPDKDLIQIVPIDRESELRNQIGRRWRLRPFVSHAARQRVPVLRIVDDFARKVVNRISRMAGRSFDGEIAPFKPHHGSQWWALTERSLREVLAGIAAHPGLAAAYRSTFAPDEMFLQTVYAGLVDRDRQVGGQSDLGTETLYDAPMHVVAPTYYRWAEDTDEFRAQIAASDKFFVRKVGSEWPDLVSWLDTRLAA